MFAQMRDNVSSKELEDLIKQIDDKSTMVEIGSYLGESTVIFAKYFDKVISIDPYLDNYDPNDIACTLAPFEDVYQQFLKNISSFKNIQHIRKKSDDAVDDIKNISFLYIDGMHTYDQVKKDILNYISKINKGGFIGGHDYHPVWSGVVQAVDECVGTPDMIFEDFSWIKKIN
jgi:predicted O-methyltransferase YrrM